MCGIVGVWSPGPVDRHRLDSALRTLDRRGPDGTNSWWSEDSRVGLGHTRLAINDEAGGVQPYEGGTAERFVVSVNGEFYGLPTGGRCDSHLLAEIYEKHGLTKTLTKLRGEFAFLLYDKLERRLTVVRDRFGIKPLFWAQRGLETWFASKPQALWAAGVKAGWCEKSFAHAAQTQYPPSGGSLFRAVNSLRPSHFLTLDGQGLSERRYWKVQASQFEFTPEDFAERLTEAVHLRVRKDHPTAVLLSGGVDSASVASLAASSGQRMKAYTIDFPQAKQQIFSEAALAREQAQHLGLKHRVIPLSAEDIVRGLPEMVRLSQGLCVNGHGVAKLRIAQAINEDGIKVLLSGEGADELLFGYRHFSPYFGEDVRAEDPAGLGILVSRNTETKLPADWPYFFRAKVNLGRKIQSFLGQDLRGQCGFERVLGGQDLVDLSSVERARQPWLDTALSSYILETLGDGTEMAASVEGRPPFLDHHLWEATPLPKSGDKRLLREAMKGRVVESIRSKAKHPFMAPALGPILYDALESQIQEIEHPYVDKDKALATLRHVRRLSDSERVEWEPAILWVLSSYHLQELWVW